MDKQNEGPLAVGEYSVIHTTHAIQSIKSKLGVAFAMDIIILMTWAIWKQRNAWLFQRLDPTVQRCYIYFKNLFDLLLYRMQLKNVFSYKQWRTQIS